MGKEVLLLESKMVKVLYDYGNGCDATLEAWNENIKG